MIEADSTRGTDSANRHQAGGKLGNIALRRSLREKLAERSLHWDATEFKVTNLPEANGYLHREYRKGWTL